MARDVETLEQMLIRHEAERFYPYRCSEGYLTIGVGHNLDTRGISKNVSRLMLKEDIDEALDNCLKVFGESVWYTLNDARKIALADMMFNLGYTNFTGFTKMIAAVKHFDYMEAARQMQDSKWYDQVGRRGAELVQIMREGVQLR